MNNLKFRAWEKHEKKYNHKVLVGNLDINDDNYTSCLIFKGKEWVHFDEHSEIVLEQYTGLKDKHGKEIYVGDIIDINQTVNGYNLFVITFENGLINVRYAHDMSQYEYDILELLDWDQLSLIETENEVMGNIHENKELL